MSIIKKNRYMFFREIIVFIVRITKTHKHTLSQSGYFLNVITGGTYLRRIYGPKRNGVTGEWRKLHNKELNDLYSSPNIVRVIKSRIIRWAGHVARIEEGRGVHKVLVGKPEGKSHWGDQDVDGRIVLRWILRKWKGLWGLDRVGSG